ncbi:MAG: transcriptional regulator FilR1 domain-containing protein [Halobacteriota archaeon]
MEEYPVELDVATLADATVTRATHEDPYEIHERYLELWENATRMRAQRGVGAVPPNIVEHIKPRLQTNFDTESVWSTVAAEQYLDSYPEVADLVREEPKTPQLVTDDPISVVLGLFGHRFSIVIHDDETGFPQTLVDISNAEAMAWADAVYEYYRERARSLEP